MTEQSKCSAGILFILIEPQAGSGEKQYTVRCPNLEIEIADLPDLFTARELMLGALEVFFAKSPADEFTETLTTVLSRNCNEAVDRFRHRQSECLAFMSAHVFVCEGAAAQLPVATYMADHWRSTLLITYEFDGDLGEWIAYCHNYGIMWFLNSTIFDDDRGEFLGQCLLALHEQVEEFGRSDWDFQQIQREAGLFNRNPGVESQIRSFELEVGPQSRVPILTIEYIQTVTRSEGGLTS